MIFTYDQLVKSIKKNTSWIAFLSLLIGFAVVATYYYDSTWINSFLQIGALILTAVFTIILSIENNKDVALNTERQIKAIAENTDRQISALQQLTNQEIETLKESTDRQIEQYRRETEKLVEQLKNNSELLAGILQRHLEDAITETHKELNNASVRYKNLQNFQILRTQEEKQAQLKQQNDFMAYVGNKLKYLQEQYHRVLHFLSGKNN